MSEKEKPVVLVSCRVPEKKRREHGFLQLNQSVLFEILQRDPSAPPLTWKDVLAEVEFMEVNDKGEPITKDGVVVTRKVSKNITSIWIGVHRSSLYGDKEK